MGSSYCAMRSSVKYLLYEWFTEDSEHCEVLGSSAEKLARGVTLLGKGLREDATSGLLFFRLQGDVT